MADLGRWLREEYRVPGTEPPPDEDPERDDEPGT
jgi:endogenous inhibitor of DNA gyrase (YacG/DUF329 family)